GEGRATIGRVIGGGPGGAECASSLSRAESATKKKGDAIRVPPFVSLARLTRRKRWANHQFFDTSSIFRGRQRGRWAGRAPIQTPGALACSAVPPTQRPVKSAAKRSSSLGSSATRARIGRSCV